jgi:mannose-1-phosphate guanylyltransferase
VSEVQIANRKSQIANPARAMILAAGLGTRLRPLTDTTPKALLPVMGRPMLDWAMAHVAAEGISEVIINLHHFPEAVTDHVGSRSNCGMHIAFSRESILLGTGGGVKRAEWFLKDTPFILRNVDVLAGFRLQPLLDRLEREKSLAVLAVQDRETSRALLWDRRGQLCGRLSGGKPRVVRRAENEVEALGFTGIHAVSPRVVEMMPGDRPFCIVEFYLEIARQGEAILCHRVDEFYWRDLGTRDSLEAAEQELAHSDGSLLQALGMTGTSRAPHSRTGTGES